MNEHGKSDRPAVPAKSPNNAGQPAAEGMEGSGLAKGNLRQQHTPRTPSRDGALRALERVREAARQDRKLRFTALLHHIYDITRLKTAYLELKREAAPGVDGETWRHYGETLEEHLRDLADRLKRGAYRAKPVRRVYIWRQKQATGDVIVVRFADDIVLGFQVKADADRFWVDLAERFRKFHLELHPEKTRLLEFGPFAAESQRRRGLGKPETFNFLSFTHLCGKKRSNGRFTVVRQTIRKRLQAKLSAVKAELRRRMHDPIPAVGTWLRSVVGGHIRYDGVPMNGRALHVFRFQVGRLWHRTLSRRSQNGRVLWDRMRRLIDRWLPPARVCHPYPLRRLGVIT